MKKGFQITLLAVAASIAGFSSSYAAAPVIRSLPDITIGDNEDSGETDSNYFRFTNAFRFDDFVSDADSDVTQLIWTFAEGDDPGSGSATQWFQINGKDPVAVGTDQIAALETADPDPRKDPDNNIREGNEWADIRDIVLSPLNQTPPFGDPGELPDNAKAAHEAGKEVTFYVFDGQNFDSDTVIIRSIDNANDFASATNVYTEHQTDTFESSAGWDILNTPVAGLQTATHNVANSALYATIGPSPAPPDNKSSAKDRAIGWLEKQAAQDPGNPHLLFSQVEPGQVIRGKFAIFAADQNDKNLIPNIRLRLAARFAFAAMTEILHHTSDAEGTQFSQDLAPSQDPNNPTVYRVDLVRPDLPFFNTPTGAAEGVQRGFEAYATTLEQFAQGTIALAESSIGVYDALPANSETLAKSYETAADFTTTFYYELRQFSRGPILDLQTANLNGDNNGGSYLGDSWGPLPAGQITATAGAGGISASTAGTPDNLIATVALDFLNGNAEDASDHRNRLRVDMNEQYLIRFHATATGASSNNAMIRFRARTAKFNYNSRLEVGGAWNVAFWDEFTNQIGGKDPNRESHILAHQFLPGSGGYTGTYDVIMVSPLTSDTPAPSLAAEDGPGAGPATRELGSRRDLYPGVDIIDSLSANFYTAGSSDPGEKGNVSVSKIEIFKFPLVED